MPTPTHTESRTHYIISAYTCVYRYAACMITMK